MKNNDWGARLGGGSAPSEPAINANNANSKSGSIANPIANPIDGDEIVLGGPDRADGPAKPDENAQAGRHEAPRIGGLLQQGRASSVMGASSKLFTYGLAYSSWIGTTGPPVTPSTKRSGSSQNDSASWMP